MVNIFILRAPYLAMLVIGRDEKGSRDQGVEGSRVRRGAWPSSGGGGYSNVKERIILGALAAWVKGEHAQRCDGETGVGHRQRGIRADGLGGCSSVARPDGKWVTVPRFSVYRHLTVTLAERPL